ncbi:MAG: DUF6263 family protein, partial [bacterium]
IEYEMNMEMEMKQNMMGKSMTTHQDQVVGFNQRILGVDEDGTINQETEFTRMGMEMRIEGPEGNEMFSSHYDSDDPDDSDREFENLGEIVGVKTTMRVSPRGEILEISGWDEAMNKMMADVPDEMRKQMEDMFGEKAMMGWMSEINASYHDEPVNVGDTWTAENELKSPFPMDLKTEMKLAKINRGSYEIHYQAEVSPPADGGAVLDFGPMPMTIELSGTAEGKIFLDRETHMLISMESEHDYDGMMKMDMSEMEDRPEQMPETMEIPVEIIQKQRLEGKFVR